MTKRLSGLPATVIPCKFRWCDSSTVNFKHKLYTNPIETDCIQFTFEFDKETANEIFFLLISRFLGWKDLRLAKSPEENVEGKRKVQILNGLHILVEFRNV